jgi:EmrB/QacA subfamily drug resistance transporter
MERKWWSLIAICVAIFMLLLDVTVVNTALPRIQSSLHASFAELQWVVNAYALTLAALLLTAGALADLFGRRLVFMIGLALFTAASLLCGLSGSAVMLDLVRGVQGVGGAMMFATSLALIAEAFTGRDRGTAFGIFGATIGGAAAVGPLVGGALTDAFGWEWIFFVNVPIGIGAVFLTLAKVDESSDPGAARIDWWGVTTFSAALFMLVFALIKGNDLGWGSATILGLLIGSLVLIVAFVLGERAQERPMLDLTLFRRPAFAGASIVAFALSASMIAMFLYLTLYIQDLLGYKPFAAGLRFLPLSVLSFGVAPLAGRLSVRIPVRVLLGIGLALVGIALLLESAVGPSSGWTVLLPGFIISGIGIGTVNAPLATTAIGVVPPARSGMASGINNTFRQVGIATGIAGLGAVFEHEVRTRTLSSLTRSGHAQDVAAAAHGHLATVLQSGQVKPLLQHLPPPAANAFAHAYRVGFTGALSECLVIAAVVAFVGAVLAFALVRGRDFVTVGQGAPAPVAEAVGASN